MFKKSLHLLLSLFFVVYSLQSTLIIVIASWNIDVTSVKINWNSSSSYSLYPWDNFSLSIFWKNNTWVDIKNASIKFWFKNQDSNYINNYFFYDWLSLKWVINFVSTINSIPSLAYDSNNWFSYEITNTNTPILGIDKTIFLDKLTPSTFTWLSISQDIKTYQNTINYNFTWKSNIDDSDIIWNIESKTIYVNVKPHITSYYFEKSDNSQTTNTVQWSDSESINLVLNVKDYNWCWNISWWTIKADLSKLWLSSSENLTYQSCQWDWKTAVFKKEWITTNSSLWTYTFNYTDFSAIDIDWNQNDSNDSNTDFDLEDEKNSLELTVVLADAPNLSLLSLNNQKIWGPDKLDYTLSFSWNQNWSWKISLWSDWNCDLGTVLYDWFDYTDSNNQIDKTINLSSLQEWNNSIYACIKNTWWSIWSINFNLTKDTISPITSFLTISPANVITNDSSIKFSCNENWEYRVEIWWNWTPWNWNLVLDWTPSLSSSEYNIPILNNLLSLWNNIVYGYCKDEATNISYNTWSVTKTPPTPSMAWTNILFSDEDFDNDWLNWKDITTSWTLTQDIIDATNFESYRVYLLPSNIDFNSSSQTHLKLISSKNTLSWT